MNVTPDLVNSLMAESFPDAAHRCVELSPTHAIARLEVDRLDLRPGGLISGPTQFRLADSVLWGRAPTYGPAARHPATVGSWTYMHR